MVNFRSATTLQGLQTLPFCADALVLVVPRGHALAQRAAVSLSEVVDYAFVGLAHGSALQAHITHHARRLGKRLSYRIRLRSFESVCQVVGQGIGVGNVPQAVAARCARSAKIKRIALTDAWAARNIVLCVRQLYELPVPARHLAQHVLAAALLPHPSP